MSRADLHGKWLQKNRLNSSAAFFEQFWNKSSRYAFVQAIGRGFANAER
jgi:hypothetical protein